MTPGMVATGTQMRCTLCPAGCGVGLTSTGPDIWRTEFSRANEGGVCPRGAMLGQLLGHRKRILAPAIRNGGLSRECTREEAVARLLEIAGDRLLLFFLDAGVPIEEMSAAAAWCAAWPKAKLCLTMEPADEQVLLGAEASGAEYLAADAVKECDGFVLIGDIFAANPTVARGVFDRRQKEPRTPIIGIDPAAGSSWKFTHQPVKCFPTGEWDALCAVAASAGVEVRPRSGDSGGNPSAEAAGKAIAGCRRLGVLIAADYGRTSSWRAIGELAGTLAKAKGGGIAVQTVGANALAAVRLAGSLGAVSLAEALLSETSVKVALGCDVLGMLGWTDSKFVGAAGAFHNITTCSAQVLLPAAAHPEVGGSFLIDNRDIVTVPAMLRPPSGIPTPAEALGLIAAAAGAAKPKIPAAPPTVRRLSPASVEPAMASDPDGTALLVAREAMHSGSGALTSQGDWQQAMKPEPEARVNPVDAVRANLKNEGQATLAFGGKSLVARVQVDPELPRGRIALSDGFAEVRRMLSCRIDHERKIVYAVPAAVSIKPLIG